MRAIVVGATGAVGSALVHELLASPRVDRVVALVRRRVSSFDAEPGHEKLTVEKIDLDDLQPATTRLAAGCDAAFCTMGIGQPRKVRFDEFRRVDVEYAGAFARGAAAAGVRHISLLSSVGASPQSASKYLRVKAEAEQAFIEAHIERTSLFRPSLLVTREIRYGLQDRLTRALFPVFAPLLPARYHQITVENLGRAMCLDSLRNTAPGVRVLHYPDFVALI